MSFSVNCKIIAFCWLFMLLRLVTCGGNVSAEHRLYTDLFTDYNTNIRPVRNENDTVSVTVIFSLQHLDDLDAQKQLLRISGWLEVEWYDQYLTWDPAQYGGVERIVVPPQKVWLPSFALDNSAGEVYDLMHYNYFRVTVYNDGYTWWEPGGKFESVCVIDITYYPFDSQVCQLTFANWAYIGKQVDLTNGSNRVNTETFGGNGEWEIVSTRAIRYEKIYDCCPDETYPEVHFLIYMQRKSLYYIINVLLPVLMLSLLELLIFVLPCDSGEKISLGITIMLGFSVFALLIEESVPNTSEATPIIVIYLTCAMGTAAVSVVISVFILATHHRGSQCNPPYWITHLVKKAKSCSLWKRKLDSRKDIVEAIHINGTIPNGRPHSAKTITNGHCTNEAVLDIPNQVDIDTSNHPGIHLEQRQLQTHREGVKQLEELYARTGDDSSLSILMSIYKQFDYLVSKYRQQQENNIVSDEWKQLARDLDSVLFWFFSVILVIMAVIILGFVPLSKGWPPVVIGGHTYFIE